MAHYEDLTPYAYGGETSDDVNVGWLRGDMPFPKAAPRPGLVEALLRCSRRAERLYRGYHDCDLCTDDASTETWPFELGGRKYYLGNGEIRVLGADQRWYTAPTLVAHYVADHQYAPPAVFVDAVIETAHRVPSLDATSFAKLAAMSPAARFELCVEVLGASNTAQNAWATQALKRIVAARPALDPSRWKELRREVDAALDATTLPKEPSDRPPEWLHDATRSVMRMLMSARIEKRFDEETLSLAADAIESILDGPADVAAWLARPGG